MHQAVCVFQPERQALCIIILQAAESQKILPPNFSAAANRRHLARDCACGENSVDKKHAVESPGSKPPAAMLPRGHAPCLTQRKSPTLWTGHQCVRWFIRPVRSRNSRPEIHPYARRLFDASAVRFQLQLLIVVGGFRESSPATKNVPCRTILEKQDSLPLVSKWMVWDIMHTGYVIKYTSRVGVPSIRCYGFGFSDQS